MPQQCLLHQQEKNTAKKNSQLLDLTALDIIQKNYQMSWFFHGTVVKQAFRQSVFKAMEKSKASVVGGGNSELYTAMYISRFAEEITVVHRGDTLRADRRVQESALSNPKIRLQLKKVVKGRRGEGGLVTAMVLEDKESGDEAELETDGIFVGIGQRPNSYVVEGIVDLDPDGFILVNRRMETSREGIYAAGDVVQKPLRQIVTAVGDGAVAADSAIHYIEGQTG